MDKELSALRTHFHLVGEIKWRYFAPPKLGSKLNPLSHLTATQKDSLRHAIYYLVTKHKSIRIICAVVDIHAAYQLNHVHNENDLYWHAYRKVIEKFQYYLEELSLTIGSKINGIIVCDQRQPKDDHQLRYLHQKLSS